MKYTEISLKDLLWDQPNMTYVGFLKLIEAKGYKIVRIEEDAERNREDLR